jgi:hypothetical protein
MDWTIKVLGFDCRQRLGIRIFTTVSRPVRGSTLSPIRWVPGAPSLQVKCPGREADHSHPSSITPYVYEPGYLSGTALDYGLDDRVFESRQWLGIFIFTTVSRLARRPTQPSVQWVAEFPSLGVKRPGREANHSLPSSAKFKNGWSCTSTPQIRLYGVMLS